MSIPSPEPGLVVHFNYLWNREAEKGRQEARYPRPCAVVLSYRRQADGALLALLAPITHSQPRTGDRAIELPQAVKRHLGLDTERSWVMLDEVNETAWPGFDLQSVDGKYAYGFLPPTLFQQIKSGILAIAQSSRLKRVRR